MEIIDSETISDMVNDPLRRKRHSYPFKGLDVGEGFMAPADKAPQDMSPQCAYWGKKLGRKFATRKTDDGVLVIRVS